MEAVITTLIGAALVAAAGWSWRTIKRHLDPYRVSYGKIDELALGLQEAYVTQLLGVPAVRCDIENGEGSTPATEVAMLVCQIYRRGQIVVAVLFDSDSTVRGVGLASCDPDFHGALRTPFGPIVLNRTRMADVDLLPHEVEYSVGGSGGFGYFVIDTCFGQTTAMQHTDVRWGQMYRCARSSVPEDLKAFGGFHFGEYTNTLEEIRRKWVVNAVLISDGGVTTAAGRAFVLALEGQTYQALKGYPKQQVTPKWRRVVGRVRLYIGSSRRSGVGR